MPVMAGDTAKLEEMMTQNEGRATLRLKKDGQAVVEEVVSYYIDLLYCQGKKAPYQKLLYLN